MKRDTEKLSFFIIMSLLIVSITLAGCREKTPKSAGPAERVTIAYTTNTNSALVQVALKKGYFADEGLEVTPQPHIFGKAAIASMLDGKADLATMAETPFMFAVMKGEKIFAIATIQTATKNEAIVARKDKGITKPQDLAGKKVGVSLGTGGEFFMDSVFALNGLERKDIRVVDLTPENMVESLMKGEVDAVTTWNPNVILLQKKLGNKGITFYGETVYTEIFCLAGSQDFVRRSPGAVQKVLKALVRTEKFIKQDPAEVQSIVADVTGMDKTLLAEIWNIFDYSVKLDQSLLVTLEDSSRWAIKNGLAKQEKIPNYLDYIYVDGLAAVKPEAVRIIR